MARIWVGDFRVKTIQEAAIRLRQQNNNKYFFEDSAELNWFSSVATKQFVAELAEKSSVILMPGFNDCVNSCVWSIFDINKIANNYANSINALVEQHPSIKFYFCSVNPVNSGFPFAEYPDKIISSETLNKKIEQFNAVIKSTCSANYIDTFAYLTSSGFDTYDGVRFNSATAASILSYISGFVNDDLSGLAFMSRLTADDAPISDGFSDNIEFWRGDSYDGLNPFDNLAGHLNSKYEGDTLPNCTAYAWGRFCEILGTTPQLSTGKVEQWYSNTEDGYNRGQDPALGAVMCWNGTATAADDGQGGKGHVAIVEQINSDGSIITSESVWNDSNYWWTTKRTKGDGNWGASSDYQFQGFIYCPAVTTIPDASETDKKFILEALKLNKVTATKFDASFITKNGSRYKYSIFDETNNKIHESAIQVNTNDDLQIIYFSYDRLEPNTSYKLVIEAVGTVGGETKAQMIRFNTPQSRPGSIKKLKLSCNDKIKSVNSTFVLEIEAPTDFGYWGKHGRGYEKHLIINGKCKKIVNIDGIPNILTKKITIKNEFGYECKTGDIIQIGIRIWTVDNNGEKIYDAPAAKTSEPICLLNNSVQAYVHVNKSAKLYIM